LFFSRLLIKILKTGVSFYFPFRNFLNSISAEKNHVSRELRVRDMRYFDKCHSSIKDLIKFEARDAREKSRAKRNTYLRGSWIIFSSGALISLSCYRTRNKLMVPWIYISSITLNISLCFEQRIDRIGNHYQLLNW